MNDDHKLNGLIEKAAALSRQQQQLNRDIQELHHEIYNLKREQALEGVTPTVKETPAAPVKATPIVTAPAPEIIIPKEEPPVAPVREAPSIPKEDSTFENFIGTNLLNKIGIVILVLGIGYGVKYSIDHQLLSPLTRIVLAYIVSAGLIVFAIRLKPRLETFSAVLLSGGMASIYFTTYAAYDFYSLIPQALAFVLMVVFTAFTVFAAIKYNLQLIAIIGLVGAYGVPFLLSDGSGRVVILFSYVAIINIGILVIAFRKSWDVLYYLAFLLTWAIFCAWWMGDFSATSHLWTSLIFSTLFFVTFYVTFLAYKVIREEAFEVVDAVKLLFNSFIYFALGYNSISDLDNGDLYLGSFTLFNAVIHFAVCVSLYGRQGKHRDTFFFAAGLVIVFITLAVPVQLDGNWVSLIWALEALVLFAIGRTKSFVIYENISYVLMALAFVSLAQDMILFYDYGSDNSRTFLFNKQFLTSIIALTCFTVIYRISRNPQFKSPHHEKSQMKLILDVATGLLVLVTAYLTFYKEIESYWNQQYLATLARPDSGVYDNDIERIGKLWLINYSAVFGIILSAGVLRFRKAGLPAIAAMMLNLMTITAFLLIGLSLLSELRESYILQTDATVFARGIGHILIRYVCLALVVPLIWLNSRLIRLAPDAERSLLDMEKVLVHFLAIVLLSSELLHWLDLAGVVDSDKLALSILWGAYALALIVRGLWKEEKTLRIFGIVVFGITLVKLFAYDIAAMSTIAKTVVMMILGTLLLVASFLYNRLKNPKK